MIFRRAGVVLLVGKGDIFKRPVNKIPFRNFILKDADKYIFVQNGMKAYALNIKTIIIEILSFSNRFYHVKNLS